MLRVILVAVLAGGASAAWATPYWIAYEGNDFPENEGWLRVWGDEEGPYHGGAERSVENGILTIDSLSDDQVCDFSEMQMSIDPGPGETFSAEWRVLIDPQSDPCDVWVVIARDNPPGHAAFSFGPSALWIDPDGVTIGLAPGVFHTFEFSSPNMRQYRLLVDGTIEYDSSFESYSILQSFVNFGDGAQGERSLSSWDYFRFGVVPEPSAILLLLLALTRRGRLAQAPARF
jgi:hypothetical protein